MYGEYEKSLGPKLALTAIHALGLSASGWILFGNGFALLSHWIGKPLMPGLLLNRALLFTCAAIYFFRICFGCFYLIHRKLGWGEAIGVGIFAAFVHTLFAFLGGTNLKLAGWFTAFGIPLYLVGSSINTGSEFLGNRWKMNPAHNGKLYTGGLFRYARHINYFGDGLLFTGYALLTGSGWAFIIPALMVFGFVFANIPALDAYLRRKYGTDFDAYAARTKKFIPYVY